jgi:ABC-type glycerol-3-phosphate transport system substrate-binding protein
MGLLLALGLTAGLCACGNNDGGMENAAMAKENVYKMEEITLPEFEGDSYYVRGTAHKDGMIYMMIEVQHWRDAVDQTDIRLISMKEDGTDMQVRQLAFPDKKENDTASVENNNIWVYDNYYNFVFSPDGKVYANRQHSYEDSSDPDNYIYEQTFYVNCWDADGSFLWEKQLEGLITEEEGIWVNNMVAASDGTVHLILSGNNIYKMSVDAQGNVSERVPVSDDVTKLFQNSESIIPREDGSFFVMYRDENDWTKAYITTYDLSTDTVGEPSEMPSSLTWGGMDYMQAGKSSDLIYTNSNGIFAYNIGDAQGTQKMSYINSDLNITSMISAMELDGNAFLGLYSEDYGQDLKAGIFNYVDPKDIPDKAVLVLAGNYVGSDLKKRIVEFNRSSEQYRIVVKEYNSYNTYEDYRAGVNQLNNDIITGNMPDILLTEGLPAENYAVKGLLADIGEMIKNDEELSQVEFVQNAFDAYSLDGKLYFVIPYFSVNTMVAKTSLVGDRTSWTMEEAQAVLSTMQENAALMGEMTRGNFFGTMMNFCAGDFVDVSTGKCNFNSPEFINMMEYAKTLPAELNEDYYGEDYWMNYRSQYRDNRTLLEYVSIGSIRNLNYTINGDMGEDVTYIGFPTESGQGSYINAYQTYAISSRSKNKEGAWEFIRFYLTEEHQKTLEYGMPIQMKYFKANAQKALEKPYYVDENNNKVEYEDSYYMNGETITLPQLNQAQIDQAVNFILSVNKRYYNNDDVMTIINEEMESFYSGQKSAQEVATIIQSRAQIYVDENR